MRTCCPGCQTIFRFTAEQLKARAGKVRCGQCQIVFNVLDNLLDESDTAPLQTTAPPPTLQPVPLQAPLANPVAQIVAPPSITDEPPLKTTGLTHHSDEKETIELAASEESKIPEEIIAEEPPAEETEPLSEAEMQELGKVTGLILPRETAEIPGYSKWAEGVIAAPLALPEEKNTRWPFVLVALLLLVVLAGQITFRFRSEIAIAVPGLRPLLQAYSEAFKTNIPLPRQVELVSIEQSDLQADPARGNLLVLNATLRNRAAYEQAYPSLELSLTDTSDAAIARKVFLPEEFLPDGVPANKPFKAKSEVTVRLWIEASEISAAGYRLYVFYP